jgi:hypothetical protein
MPGTIQQLMEAHPEELLKELAEVREKERLVAHERELLERVLEIVIEGGGPSAEWLMDDARGILPIGSLRSQVQRVLRLGPSGKAWQPREVHEKLVSHGNSKTSLDNVRVTMSRMADANQLFQPQPREALYILPPSPSAGEALVPRVFDGDIDLTRPAPEEKSRPSEEDQS